MCPSVYASVLLDANGTFSPARFGDVFLREVRRENIPYGASSRIDHSSKMPTCNPSGFIGVLRPTSNEPFNTQSSVHVRPSFYSSFHSPLPMGTSCDPSSSASASRPSPTVQAEMPVYSLTRPESERDSNAQSGVSFRMLSSSPRPSALSREDSFSGLEEISDEDEDEGENVEGNLLKASQQSDYDLGLSCSHIVSPQPSETVQNPVSYALKVLDPECIETPIQPKDVNTPFHVQNIVQTNGNSKTNSFALTTLGSLVKHKLKLVLDLDNTLLHACSLSKLCNVKIRLEDFKSPENDPELYTFRLSSFFNQLYHVKFRPGVRRFLSELAQYCDLGIHTNATHEYADVIVSILDPDYSLFQGRVASREDETTKDHKKNMGRLFRVDDLDMSSLIILDDRKDVWDNMYHPNIVKCSMYDYLDARKTALVEKYQERNTLGIDCNGTEFTQETDGNNKNNEKHRVCSSDTVRSDGATVICCDSSAMVTNADDDSVEQRCGAVGTVGGENEAENADSNVLSNDLASQSIPPYPTALNCNDTQCSYDEPNDVDTLATHAREGNMSYSAPFLDNPLVEQSRLGLQRGFDEADNYEDDDVILLDGQKSMMSDDSGALHNLRNGDASAACSNGSEASEEPSMFTRHDAASSKDTATLAAHFGVTEDVVTGNMRLAMKLCNVDQALIDFDTQLDDIRELVIDTALEYNRRKDDPRFSDSVSVAQILNERRQSILKDVVVQTVGMYKSETSHPEYGWHDNGPVHRRRLVRLGAQVVDSPVPELTHIMAMRATQTIDRVRRERGQSVHYVHALWLHACESTWRRVPEKWFPAFTLLQKYDNLPPMKPWVDHWQLVALQNPSPNLRLLNVLKQNSSPDEQQLQSSAPEHPVPSQVLRRLHYVLSPLSAGAEVWSANEHVTLTYDPLSAAQRKLRLNLTLTQAESEALAEYERQRLEKQTQISRRNMCQNQQIHFGPSIQRNIARYPHATGHIYRGWEKRKRNNFHFREYSAQYSGSTTNVGPHYRCWPRHHYPHRNAKGTSPGAPGNLLKQRLFSTSNLDNVHPNEVAMGN